MLELVEETVDEQRERDEDMEDERLVRLAVATADAVQTRKHARALKRSIAYAKPRGLLRRLRDSLPEGRAIAEEVWQRRHRAMITLLWVHAAVIVGYGVASHHTFAHSLFEGNLVAMAAGMAKWGPKNRRFQSVTATLGMTTASAILVHLSRGVIELHFHYFFALAVISLYHDWAPFLTAIGFVALEHGVAGVLDPHAVYNHPDAIAHPWKWAGIHAFFVLATSAVSLIRWKSSEDEALKDPLTNLPNRTLFGDRLRQALLRRETMGGHLAVLFLDVDDFKTINDTAGHSAGDRLLVVVADRLRDVVRAPDTVARLGGDEFAIVLELDEAGSMAVAERILAALRAPLSFEGRELSVTASIGLACRTSDEGEADLLRNADIAMYVAKKSGKGRYVVFDASMHQAVTERNELAKGLEGAVARGELRVAYQPVVMLSDGTITGFEALLRWEHPRFGMLAPSRFIPLAEESGEIVAIGRWLLHEACTQARLWEDEFRTEVPRSISVNVSVRQLVEPAFPEHVIEALRASHLDPDRLILEITETSLVGDNSGIVRSLHHLKSLGVRIALDDFGTGYSSLGYLRRLPIDILKIDKTFIDGVDQGAEDAALARAILKIAESMSLQCIAEGVERKTQATQLIAAGCKLAQGFLFSKAVEPHRVGALLFWHPRPPKARGTILIVDDESAFRASIARRLGEAGFATVEASNGVEALDTLAERSVDLIMLDVNLPDVNGLDLGMQIRRDPALSSIPIMIVSGDPVVAPSGPEPSAGIDAFVQKPFRDAELLSSVTRLIDRPIQRAGANR